MKSLKDYVCPALEITTVIGCRVNCKYCPQTVLLDAYFKDDPNRERKMTFETFQKCIDKMPSSTTVIFSGAAEPMLNDSVYDMILYANKTGRRIRLLTTLEGMTMEGFKRIQDVSFEAVVLHAPDSENYAKITMNESYFELLDAVISKNNSNGEPFIDWCNCQGTFHPDFLNHITGNIKGIDQKTTLHDRAGNIIDNDNAGTISKKEIKGMMLCGGSFPVLNHFMLLPDGSVCLCCMDFGMKHVLGNLLEMSYKDIRHSNELRKVEQGMLWDESKNILCRNCSYGRKMSDLFKAMIKN